MNVRQSHVGVIPDGNAIRRRKDSRTYNCLCGRFFLQSLENVVAYICEGQTYTLRTGVARRAEFSNRLNYVSPNVGTTVRPCALPIWDVGR